MHRKRPHSGLERSCSVQTRASMVTHCPSPRHLRTTKAFVVLMVDLLDVSGTLLPRLRDMVGANPVVVVGTKLDLMPAGVRQDQLAAWLQSAVEFKGLRSVAVYLVRLALCAWHRDGRAAGPACISGTRAGLP